MAMVASDAHSSGPAPVGPPDVADQVIKARSGDRLAFHQLVDRFHPAVYRMIYYRTRSRMDAEDLTQDVFLQAYKHMGKLQSPEKFRGWLFRIALNRVRDYHRKKQFRALFSIGSTDDDQQPEPADPLERPSAESRLDRHRFWQQVGTLLAPLARMEREVFLLRFFDQLSIKEMTQTLKKNESTVKTHLYRALKKVKADADNWRSLTEMLP